MAIDFLWFRYRKFTLISATKFQNHHRSVGIIILLLLVVRYKKSRSTGYSSNLLASTSSSTTIEETIHNTRNEREVISSSTSTLLLLALLTIAAGEWTLQMNTNWSSGIRQELWTDSSWRSIKRLPKTGLEFQGSQGGASLWLNQRIIFYVKLDELIFSFSCFWGTPW